MVLIMQYQWFVVGFGIVDWFLLSLSLFLISKKLPWEKRWKAWIPGLRFYALGNSIELHTDGIVCCILDLFFVISALGRVVVTQAESGVLLSLIHLVVFLFYFIYRIRIFIRILHMFGLKYKWILLWLVANWLAILIIAAGKKYQLREDYPLEETWEAGTKPQQIKDAEAYSASVPLLNEGLSIHIRERTVKESGKKRYLLKDIALNIPNNSLVLLLGGSGSGKTTMVNAVIGYEKADATILLNGKDVYKDYNSVKYRIGFVPQQNLIRGKDTVISTVNDAADLKLPVSMSREDRNEKISDAMDLLGLSAGQEGLVSKKSGGQLRRICIAMELVADPELFVLDEPDSGLDGVISREIFTKLRKIADEGRIVIVITHTPDRVIDLFDKVIVLARDEGRVGRLAFYGSPDEARQFFGKDSMEEIVMSINSKDEGGDGLADEYIEKYAKLSISKEGK